MVSGRESRIDFAGFRPFSVAIQMRLSLPLASGLDHIIAVSTFSTGRFSMVMFTRSLRDSFLLASRISIPTMCLFPSRSTVTPSSMSILSSTSASLSWMYKASASLSYSILTVNHLHPFRFLTAEITRKVSGFSLYVILRNFPDVSIHAFSRPSAEGSRCAGSPIADSTSLSSILCKRILFLACLTYFIGFITEIISDSLSSCKQRRNSDLPEQEINGCRSFMGRQALALPGCVHLNILMIPPSVVKLRRHCRPRSVFFS